MKTRYLLLTIIGGVIGAGALAILVIYAILWLLLFLGALFCYAVCNE